LPLGLRLQDAWSFANYFPGANREAVTHLQRLGEPGAERLIYLWGSASAGKTHLLHAACRAFAERAAPTAYVPLTEARALTPDLLDDLEQCALVAIDDVESIAGNVAWEEALFHLFNRVQAAGGNFVVTAHVAPAALALKLADLRSRLGWGLVLQLHPLDETGCIAALQLRARRRGFDLPDDVAHYLLRRAPRDPSSLFALLDRLDDASLAAQRKLTIPFVRELL
jgi:DnaA family protein